MGKWQFWIDRGGTFTDVVAIDPEGKFHTRKFLSVAPEHYADAALHGIRSFLDISADEPIPPARISVVKMGTTVATNALLERKGTPVLFVTTQGFGDVLRIGYQNRPDIFARHIVLPEMLYARNAEVPERIRSDGQVLLPLDEEVARTLLQKAHADGLRACAIALMHGYRYPRHELELANMAREIGFSQVSTSHDTSPLQKLVSRGHTTVADAYLTPTLQNYITTLQHELAGTKLFFMQSHGGLTASERFCGKDSVLSGPAGGVVGAAEAARDAGYAKAITFDMGGTSTDVALYDGDFARGVDNEVAGIRLHVPMLQIETVAAGGGSVLRYEQGRCQVGPESAGATPGPTAYGRGGPLTLTDCHVLLGRLQPQFFPSLFGPDGTAPLAAHDVDAAFRLLAQEMAGPEGTPQKPEEIAEGFLRIGDENMANAVKQISVQRGHDPSEFALVCFGGAGGQHACRVADVLGMKTILLHPYAGVLSAFGMGCAARRIIKNQSIDQPWAEALRETLATSIAKLRAQATAELCTAQADQARCDVKVHLELRYQGADTSFPVEVLENPKRWDLGSIRRAFEAAHERCFGFLQNERGVVIARLAVEISIGEDTSKPPRVSQAFDAAQPAAVPVARVKAYMGGAWLETPLYHRAQLRTGQEVVGPAIVQETSATTIIEPGWFGSVDDHDHFILRRKTPRPRSEKASSNVDPVMLELFHNAFMSIAEQMGATLGRSAHSVNIKERLDFSCALFDAHGQLVANAPHVPVHLGSMGQAVEHVIAQNPIMGVGDAYAINAPYQGGTHLPDITVVSPVFDESGLHRLGFVASRGHHADIGGIAPGSMPANSRTIEEEGVLLDNFRLKQRGVFQTEAFWQKLHEGVHPVRNPHQNVADIQAQLAANETGIREYRKLVDHYGLPTVQSYMQHIQDHAEEAVRAVIDVLDDGNYIHTMDSGAEIHVAIRVDRKRRCAHIDFSGTSPTQSDNQNAPRAVCVAAVLYVFRTMVDAKIPLNAGCLRPLHIHIPPGSMLDPRAPAAVVAGNVETSQAVTEALYGALGVMASSQGTMNNLLFGDETLQYYETIGGGAGAGPGFAGASAVHTHMTNSRLTDPEVLESRYPVVLERFSVRTGSGGAGRWAGGDGIVRQIRFLRPMQASILSNHRRRGPRGAGGGEDGLPGVNRLQPAAGPPIPLASNCTFDVSPGDAILLLTPGGGGYGKPPPDEPQEG